VFFLWGSGKEGGETRSEGTLASLLGGKRGGSEGVAKFTAREKIKGKKRREGGGEMVRLFRHLARGPSERGRRKKGAKRGGGPRLLL